MATISEPISVLPPGRFSTTVVCLNASCRPLATARERLNGFLANPAKHTRHAAKVLLKFKLLEWGQISKSEFNDWAAHVPYLHSLHQRFGQDLSLTTWLDMMLAELERSGAVQLEGEMLLDA